MQQKSFSKNLLTVTSHWRRLVLFAAFGVALAQSALLIHQIHDFDTPHQLVCQLCLFSTGQTAALLAAPPVVPAPAATQESPLILASRAILPAVRHPARARAPPA